MKTKNKVSASLEIAIVLCSLFLVALPTIAADQTQEMQKASASEVTTASEDDYVLGIYGNANEDDTIDMRDLTYVKLIFFGKKPETELADAKYDGKINPLDFIQIKLIIVGKEKELTYVDLSGEAETVNKPIERLMDYSAGYATEVMRALDATDKTVAVCSSITNNDIFFPELSKLPSVGGSWYTPDYEAILTKNPDAFIEYVYSERCWKTKKETYKEKLLGVHIISLSFVSPMSDELTETGGGAGERSGLIENARKLGYILDKEDEADEFCDWYGGYLDLITSRTEGLSEDQKPRVFTAWLGDYKFCKGAYCQVVTLAGGIDLLEGLPSYYGTVDPEWLMEQNPDFIMRHGPYPYYSYGEDDPSEMIAIRDNILNLPELTNVNAVKNGNVYVHTSKTASGPHTIVLTVYYAKLFHPELFEDLDPEAIHQEYLDSFQHLDYDLDEHGIFVYPPIEIDGGLAGIPDKYKGQI